MPANKSAFQLSGIKSTTTPEKRPAEYQILKPSSMKSPTTSTTPTAVSKPAELASPTTSKRPEPSLSHKSPAKRRESSSSSSHHHRRSAGTYRGEITSPPVHREPEKPAINPKPIRENARKGLKDALRARMDKADEEAVKMSDSELTDLVEDVESELYRLYNRDVGPKYKNKYRTLVFNLKDEKNHGLFRKVVSGKISPRSLVAMTPEELANKELQQWRQAELKQDIEKIKQHELDLIARGGKVVIKTHKGDQVIESDGVEKQETVAAASEDGKAKLPDEIVAMAKEGDKKKDSKRKDDDRHRRRHGSKDRDRHRHSSRDKDRKSGSGSGSGSSSSRHKTDKHRSSESRHHSSSSKDAKDKDRHHHSSSSSSRDKEKRRSSDSSHRHHHKHHKSSSSSSKDREREERKKESSVEKEKKEESDKRTKEEAEELKRKEAAEREEEARKKALSDKAEKILSKFKAQAMQPISIDAGEEEASAKNEDLKPEEEDDGVRTPPPLPSMLKPSEAATADTTSPKNDEVSSTVNIKTPERQHADEDPNDPAVWEGGVDMPDVAKFSVTAHAVSGNTDYLTVDLSNSMKIVGRIPPKTIWDYLQQVCHAYSV